MHAENEYAARRRALKDAAGKFDAAHAGQRKIENNDIGHGLPQMRAA
jgi:hypothetical protein